MIKNSLLVVFAFLVLPSLAKAQIPPGYYDSVDTSNSTILRQTIHEVIDDHQRFPYTSSATDTWNILELAQENPANSGQIVDVYRNRSFAKEGGGNSNYNREHTWPKSYGFPDDNSSNYPYTDCHVLFLCDDGYNSSRSNKPFGTVDASATEHTTFATNGQGGGSGVYLGNSNWASSSLWETWHGRRGDVARALFYSDVRYEGGTHGVTSVSEPDLILTDDLVLVANSSTGNNLSVAYMGKLSVLLQWHLDDPVDDVERNGHNVVHSFQGNRNPFVDHPEWVDCLFGSACATPDPIAYCFGDGTGNFCPCGNVGITGHGCGNSASAGGCRLVSMGTTSLSADDFGLAAQNSTDSAPGLFFEGTIAVNSGFGLTFGDGLRCVGGSVNRLEVVVSSLFGDAFSSQSIATGSGITPGDVRHYQWWYRDSAPVPCGNAFNLSNAIEVVWTP
ncbi:MAG: endonuclease I [Planctomycetota bacterium]|jgi:endonuclease I